MKDKEKDLRSDKNGWSSTLRKNDEFRGRDNGCYKEKKVDFVRRSDQLRRAWNATPVGTAFNSAATERCACFFLSEVDRATFRLLSVKYRGCYILR